MKSEASKHGDPRHHGEDIAKLKKRIEELEKENDMLREEVGWRPRGW